jgi:copper ion binding protein
MSESILRVTDVSAAEQRGGCGCGCGSNDVAAASPTQAATAVTATFQVTGMTCGHCVTAVTQEVTAGVPGVSQVQVDLASGQVTVSSDRPVSEDAVKDAVEEAGYQLVPGSLR